MEPGTGKTAPGYFWVYHHNEHGVLFDWHKSRANTCLENILIGGDGEPSFSGYLQSDGLRAYRTFINRYPELSITPVSCLTHIARKFKEARNEHPHIAARILLLIGMIYQIEKRMDQEKAEPLDRQRARWLESRKPYDHLRKLVRRVIRFRGLTPRDGLYRALAYDRLRLFAVTRSALWERIDLLALLKSYGTASGRFKMIGALNDAWLPGFAPAKT